MYLEKLYIKFNFKILEKIFLIKTKDCLEYKKIMCQKELLIRVMNVVPLGCLIKASSLTREKLNIGTRMPSIAFIFIACYYIT